jgi:hypothetical protein
MSDLFHIYPTLYMYIGYTTPDWIDVPHTWGTRTSTHPHPFFLQQIWQISQEFCYFFIYFWSSFRKLLLLYDSDVLVRQAAILLLLIVGNYKSLRWSGNRWILSTVESIHKHTEHTDIHKDKTVISEEWFFQLIKENRPKPLGNKMDLLQETMAALLISNRRITYGLEEHARKRP